MENQRFVRVLPRSAEGEVLRRSLTRVVETLSFGRSAVAAVAYGNSVRVAKGVAGVKPYRFSAPHKYFLFQRFLGVDYSRSWIFQGLLYEGNQKSVSLQIYYKVSPGRLHASMS